MIPEQIQFTTFGHQKYGEWVRLGPCLRRGSRRPCCSQQNLSNERLRNTRQNTSSTQGGWCQTRAQPKDTQTIIQPSRSSQKQLPHQDKDRNPTSPPVAKQENHLATGPQGAREQAPNETFPRRGYLTSRKRDFSKERGRCERARSATNPQTLRFGNLRPMGSGMVFITRRSKRDDERCRPTAAKNVRFPPRGNLTATKQQISTLTHRGGKITSPGRHISLRGKFDVCGRL